MLGYRHAFHAGGAADVLKHLVLVHIFDYLNLKAKPYWYIDTHAGAGFYALEDPYAQKKGEFREGIARLWGRNDLPLPVARYVKLIQAWNPEQSLRHYPGSPYIAAACLRPQDTMRLFELHPTDYQLLRDNVERLGRTVWPQKDDGFQRLCALLPPTPRRAVVLIDPSYETKQDYETLISCLTAALKRFSTGIYAIWYPILQRREALQLADQLKALPVQHWLSTRLLTRHASPDGFGLQGSGLFVIHPPWTLAATLKEALPFLTDALAKDAGAHYTLEEKTC